MTDEQVNSAKNIATVGFAKHMGIELIEATTERVRAKLVIGPELCTTGGIMHGGAVMAFADTVGAIGARLNLPEGSNGTTTTESKTNFLRGTPEGTTVIAEATPIKIGRRLSVWQTRISTSDDKLVALITQSQMVL